MKVTKLLLLAGGLLSGLLLWPCIALPVVPKADVAARMDSVMRVFAERTSFSGVVLAAEKGRPVFAKAFGYANREWHVPNTLDTRFKLASLGKQFTAVLILQLAEAGKLSLDDRLVTYVPEMHAANADRITLRQLLHHTSGIANYHVIPNFENEERLPLSRTAFLSLFQDKPLLFEPGTDFQYTNLGYFLLALVAERVSGSSFDALLQTRIFKPAGMLDTYLEDTLAVMERAASGYVNTFTHYEHARYRDPSSVVGAGNVNSTAMDLLRYDQALRAGRLLSPSSQKMMYTPGAEDYGMGWYITRYPVPARDSVTLVYHDGGASGAASAMYRFLEDDRCIVVLSNVSPYDCYGIARALGRIMHDRTYDLPKRSLVARFANTLAQQGIAAAVAEFKALQARSSEYELDGSAFNQLGYQYLRADMLDAAVAVFELNVEAFPQVADPYDSLAEAYLKQGRTADAIRNYERSLELDPNNANAATILERLKRGTH